MNKITQKQLIESLKQLKDIKPRQEWAVLLKSQILKAQQVQPEIIAQKVSFADAISNFKSQFSNSFSRKLVYALSAFLFLIVGVFGITKFLPVTQVQKQPAALTNPTGLNSDVALLNSQINNLALVTKEKQTANVPSSITAIKTKVSQLAKSLKDNPKQDSQTIKDLATGLKTLADVPGTDLSKNSDIQDLYQVVVVSQIADLQKETLTDDQKKTLTQAEDLAKTGKYSDALEKILLISK